LQGLFDILPQVAESASTVLLEGASGTGKELFARAIHHLSPRRKGPFVAVNCGALPDTLLESELFGHKAGAFTDARRDRVGRFSRADGGTLLLDEIGDISSAMQVRLLRVFQDRAVEPLGAAGPEPVDVRVVAATHRDLAEEVRRGRFRRDLYYRIRVVHLTLPPLSERRQDIPLLATHFVEKLNHLQGREIAGFAPEAMACLLAHDFPGNVRELENIVEQAFVFCRGDLIEPRHLPVELRPAPLSGASDAGGGFSLRRMEQELIVEALEACGGNRKEAAKRLGIDPSTLYRKIRSLALPVPDADGRGRRRG
jgi:DNA-binding NtrC family response regulator